MILINWSNTINFDKSFIHNLCVPDILSSRYVIFLEDNKLVKESLFVYFSTRTHLQNSFEMEVSRICLRLFVSQQSIP